MSGALRSDAAITASGNARRILGAQSGEIPHGSASPWRVRPTAAGNLHPPRTERFVLVMEETVVWLSEFVNHSVGVAPYVCRHRFGMRRETGSV